MNKGVVAVLALVAAAIAGPAAAQGADPSGIYLGGSLGYAEYKDNCKNLVVQCEDHDSAWRFFGGYQFNRNWSVELGYGDMGESSGQGTTNFGVTGRFSRKTYGFDLSGIGSIYMTQRLAAYGRLGAYMVRTTYDEDIPGLLDTHTGQTNSGFMFGAGLSYTLGRLGVRAEWIRYDNVGGGDTGPNVVNNLDEIDVLSISVLFRF
jgi:OmpA-OmpF porin, OOP family